MRKLLSVFQLPTQCMIRMPEICSRYEESFGEDMARFYLAEITLAVHSVHSMGFVHR
jgi:serine/threonine protein kinase